MEILTGRKSSNLHIGISPRIYRNDYDTHYTMSNIADRIISDMQYEEKLKKIAEQKDNFRKGRVIHND